MKKAIIALLAFGALSLAAAPARADRATVIDGEQTAITTGNDNASRQDSTQGVRNHSRDSSDNAGTSIRSTQTSDTYGDRNTSRQNSDQRVDNNSLRDSSSY